MLDQTISTGPMCVYIYIYIYIYIYTHTHLRKMSFTVSVEKYINITMNIGKYFTILSTNLFYFLTK